MQPLARPPRHARIVPPPSVPRAPAEMKPQPSQHRIERGLALQPPTLPPQRPARRAHRAAKPRIIGEVRPKSPRLANPRLRQIEHAVGEAAFVACLSVMQLSRLDQDDPSLRAPPPRAAAEEILHAALGHAHQPLVMPMKVVRVSREPRPDRLDAADPVAHQPNPIGKRCHRVTLHAPLSARPPARGLDLSEVYT
jgi:hypothetical protein